MGRHTGKLGVVKVTSTAVGELLSWKLNTAHAEVDTSALGDTWDTLEGGSGSWDGEITVRLNHGEAGQELLVSGTKVDLSFYTEGDASGKKFWSGTALLTSEGTGVDRNAAVDMTFNFKGDGALSYAAVS